MKKPGKELCRKIILIFLGTVGIAFLVFMSDNGKKLLQDEHGQSVLQRNAPGMGSREEDLEVQIGDLKESVTVKVSEEKYTKEELENVFEEAARKLETLILGENKSLDEVRSDLDLITEIPETGITIAWELDNYEVMDQQGKLRQEVVDASGILLKLDAVLSYGEETFYHTFYVHIYPTKLTKAERWLQDLKAETERLDKEQATKDKMSLPTSVDGQQVIWKYVTDFRAVGILLLGTILAMLCYAAEGQRKKEEDKARKKQMEFDYPQLISRFTLYLGAGLPVRNAWSKIVQSYEEEEKRNGRREIYEEMAYTMHEISSGASESECYERFGERCGLTKYRKFGTLLSQNLKKGSRGISELLKQEAFQAFEERKDFAKKLGEEAGTKMLAPMFLMLGVVLVIIVVPAFFSVQI